MTEKVTLCKLDDIAPGAAKRFDVGKHRVAVVRCDGEVYAVGDTCTHADFSLSEGEVYCDEREIECWKHGSTFSLITGEPQSLPATRAVPVYKVDIEGDDVVVTLP
ncbi:MAG: 3-phenylpropionate/trans-cinnamate dioxygenase ferredoxin component [Acidimicrobiaceae bacterium]|jgi:3-phenylpropionate/trans-cinnamate dioxygenase ferredoxin subunit